MIKTNSKVETLQLIVYEDEMICKRPSIDLI